MYAVYCIQVHVVVHRVHRVFQIPMKDCKKNIVSFITWKKDGRKINSKVAEIKEEEKVNKKLTKLV